MKTAYNSPQMRIIGVNDVIATSIHTVDNTFHGGYQSLSPDRKDIWTKQQ